MKGKATSKTKRSMARNTTKTVTLAVVGNRIRKTGDVEPNGDIKTGQGHKIVFLYPDPPKTFALFIIRFTPPSGGNPSHESPFTAFAYAVDDGSRTLNVKSAAKKGNYDYRLALVDANGDLVTEDPQIIVQ